MGSMKKMADGMIDDIANEQAYARGFKEGSESAMRDMYNEINQQKIRMEILNLATRESVTRNGSSYLHAAKEMLAFVNGGDDTDKHEHTAEDTVAGAQVEVSGNTDSTPIIPCGLPYLHGEHMWHDSDNDPCCRWCTGKGPAPAV